MKKVVKIITDCEGNYGGAVPNEIFEWAYILDTKTLEVTKVKVKKEQ